MLWFPFYHSILLTIIQIKIVVILYNIELILFPFFPSPLPPSRAKLRHKINSVEVNDNIEGMTVSQIRMENGDVQEPRRMVTWKDTINNRSPNSQRLDQINTRNHKSEFDHFNKKNANSKNLDGTTVSNKQSSKIEQNKLNKITKYNLNKKGIKVRNLTIDLDYSSMLDTNRSVNETKHEDSLKHVSKNGYIKGSPKSRHQGKKKGKTRNKNLMKIENIEHEDVMDNGPLKLPFSVSKFKAKILSGRKIENLKKNFYNNNCQVIIEEESEICNEEEFKCNMTDSLVEQLTDPVCLENISNNTVAQSQLLLESSEDANATTHLAHKNIYNKVDCYNVNIDLPIVMEKPISFANTNVEDIDNNDKSTEYFQNVYVTIDDLNSKNDKTKIYDNKWRNSDILCAVQEICNKEKYLSDGLEGSMQQIKIPVDDEYFNNMNKYFEGSDLNNKNLDNNIARNKYSKAKHRTLNKLDIRTDSTINSSQNNDLKNVSILKTNSSNDTAIKYSQNSDIPNVEVVTTISSDNAINNYSSQNTDFPTLDILKSFSIDDTTEGSYSNMNILKSGDQTATNNSGFENIGILETIYSDDEITNSENSKFYSLEIVKTKSLNDTENNVSNNDSDFENIEDIESDDDNLKDTYKDFDMLKTISSENTVNISQTSDFEKFEMDNLGDTGIKNDYPNDTKILKFTGDDFQFISDNEEQYVNEKPNNSAHIIFSKEKVFPTISAEVNSNNGNKSNIESDREFSFSRIDILHKISCEEMDIESLDCTDINKWNEALSAARLERNTRKCSSAICLETNKAYETVFVTNTCCNIASKNCDSEEEEDELYEDTIQGDCLEIKTNQVDQVLEIASEQFIASYRSNDDLNHINNYNKMSVYYSESSEEQVPAKRRKICQDDKNDSLSIDTCSSFRSNESSNSNKNIFKYNLNENLRKIKLEKNKVEQERDEKDTICSPNEICDKNVDVFDSAATYKSNSACTVISTDITNPVTCPVG